MTSAAPCCFKAPVRREGQRIVTRFQLMDEMEDDLCSEVHSSSLQMHSCFPSPLHMLHAQCYAIGKRCVSSCLLARHASVALFWDLPGRYLHACLKLIIADVANFYVL